MKLHNLLKNNAKLYMIMGIIILVGTIGTSFALTMSRFNAIGIESTAMDISADISYDDASNDSKIVSNGNMLPISDNLITGPNVSDPRVLKAKFYVTGDSNNPDDTIYDIALHDINIDCDLRTTDLKWRLYKGDELISKQNANLSPTFDTMAGNRLVLTETQQDLTENAQEYTFLLWISESCSGDITSCDSSMDQSKYLNKNLSANIKVELSTKNKKELVRATGSADSCSYIETEVPACNNLKYNGGSQLLASSGSTYTLVNNTGINAGTYAVTAKLNDGYKWSDGTTDDRVISCSIGKYGVTVTTLDQTIRYGSSISNTVSDVSTSGFLSGDIIDSISLSSSIVEVGTGIISTNNIKIVDSNGNEVTNNYNINKNNSGVLTIKCLNTAIEPTVEDKTYNGEEQIGVTGGAYIDLFGVTKKTEVGEYKVEATPKKNYCWSDDTATTKEYTWKIISNLNIELKDKEVEYTGSSVSIDEATITDSNGTILTDIPVTYKYYEGNSCSGVVMKSNPVNAGSYSVKAYPETSDFSSSSVSNCAKLTITKATPTLTSSVSNLSLTYPTAGSFTYTYNGDGTVTCSSSSTSIATCSVNTSTKTVTVTPVEGGSATITLSASAGTNYNATSTTVIIDVSKNLTATFYYYDGSSIASTTSTCALIGTETSCSVTVPNAVSTSTGPYGNAYVGIGTSANSMSTTASYSISANTTYYAVYRSTVNIYRPTSTSAASSTMAYRNSFFTSTSAISTVLSTTTTGTSNMTSVSGIYGTLNGFATSVNSTTITYSSIAALATSTTTTAYAISASNVTVTFYYYNGSSQSSTTGSGNKIYYCSSTSSVTAGNGEISIPSVVTSSTGINNSSYYGLSTSKSSSTITSNLTTAYTTYYAVYKGLWTASYTKDSNVSSIGATSNSCIDYNVTNGSTYSSSGCTITLPSINVEQYYEPIGWYDSSDTKAGDAGETITIKSNVNYTAKARYLEATFYSYDNSKTGVECSDVSCMLDKLYEISERGEATITVSQSNISLIYPNTGTFTYEYNGDGTIKCSSSNTSIATCSIDTTSNTVTVRPIAIGSATITLSASAGTNYKGTSNTVSLTVLEGLTTTFYYYDGSSIASTTSTCTKTKDETSCIVPIPSEVSSSKGPDDSAYYGISTSTSSSTTTTSPTSAYTKYYAVYKGAWNASYTKDDTVSSIGSTSNSCTNYKTTNGSTYTSTSCSITLPSINLSSYYDEPGWYDSSDTKVGNAGDSITLSSNVTYNAKARYLEASYYSYDNSKTGVDCSDVSCMLDKLYEFIE